MNKEQQLRVARWAQIFREQKESGLTANAYIKEHGIDRSTYYYWKRRLKKLYVDSVSESDIQLPQPTTYAPSVPQEHHEFVELAYESKLSASNDSISAVLDNGHIHIELRNSASPEMIKIILEVMSHA